MKKLISILLALALILSLSVSIFADEPTGTIKITNATKEETYTVYKIFDARPTEDGTGVSYFIDPEAEPALFKALFGADGTEPNPYFTYIAASNYVNKLNTANDSEVIAYLTNLILGDGTAQNPGVAVSVKQTQENVQDTEVVFSGLPYGYYLVTSSLGAVVTLDSNTPLAEVIDKNQNPGAIDKQVVTGAMEDVLKDAEDGTIDYVFSDGNSASIGDLVTYKITFAATNYDGDQPVKYYQVNDVKGEGIWAEFDSITVKVNGETLKKGYYLPIGSAKNTNGWKWLGDWEDVPENERDRNDAEWYLVHIGFDQFRITIPWLEDHRVAGNETGENPGPYSLDFDSTQPKYDPMVNVEIMYEAAIEPVATIGKNDTTNLYNTASLTWITTHDIFTGGEDRVETLTYGIGLIKEDSATHENLAGATFQIFADEALTVPVFVIPTDVEGVYIVDSLNCPSEGISGDVMENAREKYGKAEDGGQDRLLAYLDGDLSNQKNVVVSQVNGRLIILGLTEGDYYLLETDPPSGYNALSKAQPVTVDDTYSTFTIFANQEGKVADIQQADGVYSEISYHLATVTVQNSQGQALPSTGGEGTFWLITIGTLMAIGFAVFLITHKKMSVYTD